MRYLLLVFDDSERLAELDPTERARVVGEHAEFAAAIRRSGQLRSGNALEPTTTATTLRVRHGKRTLVDGACGGGTEELVGYFEVEAADLDEALALAARIPAACFGAVEVRPLHRSL